MTIAVESMRGRGRPQMGRPKPRLAPPTPARSGWRAFSALAAELGIVLRPWQETVARYLEAEGRDGRWLFREVAVVVARQNGKTEILVPLIVRRMLAGQKVMHTAQNRDLPREVFGRVADIFEDHYPGMIHSRTERPGKARFANGQEEIKLDNGASYRIVAPTRGGARGPSNDLVIVDELREMETFDFIAAAKPTLTVSPKPQMVYLSNAGTDDSIVLNKLKKRAEEDPVLAYLEWSAAPDRAPDDPTGWLESNPSMGHDPALFFTLQDDYRSARLEGTLSIFEIEHLCRWVPTLRERLLDEFAWNGCEAPEALVDPRRPKMAVSVDPAGRRASAAIAWQIPGDDPTIGLRLLFDVTGEPIDLDRLGRDMKLAAQRLGVPLVGFDPITDAGLAKHFRKTEPITGAKFAAASSTFVTAAKGRRIAWQDVDAVTSDLLFTTRKANDEKGSFEAVRANDDRPITAALASIRAVWLASGPNPTAPKVM